MVYYPYVSNQWNSEIYLCVKCALDKMFVRRSLLVLLIESWDGRHQANLAGRHSPSHTHVSRTGCLTEKLQSHTQHLLMIDHIPSQEWW